MRKPTSEFKMSVALLVGGLLAWGIFGYFILPTLIRWVYAGGGPALLQGIVAGRGEHALDTYLVAGRQLWQSGVLLLLAVWGVYWLLNRRFVRACTPGTLGAIRFVVFGVLLIKTLTEDLASSAFLPAEMRVPMGILEVLYALPIGFDTLHQSYAALHTLQLVTIAFLCLAA